MNNRAALRAYTNLQSSLLTPPTQLQNPAADDILGGLKNDPDAAETTKALAAPIAAVAPHTLAAHPRRTRHSLCSRHSMMTRRRCRPRSSSSLPCWPRRIAWH